MSIPSSTRFRVDVFYREAGPLDAPVIFRHRGKDYDLIHIGGRIALLQKHFRSSIEDGPPLLRRPVLLFELF